jgi:hypothetical protein
VAALANLVAYFVVGLPLAAILSYKAEVGVQGLWGTVITATGLSGGWMLAGLLDISLSVCSLSASLAGSQHWRCINAPLTGHLPACWSDVLPAGWVYRRLHCLSFSYLAHLLAWLSTGYHCQAAVSAAPA